MILTTLHVRRWMDIQDGANSETGTMTDAGDVQACCCSEGSGLEIREPDMDSEIANPLRTQPGRREDANSNSKSSTFGFRHDRPTRIPSAGVGA